MIKGFDSEKKRTGELCSNLEEMVSSLLRITTSYLGLFSYLVYEIALRAFYNILILVLFLLKH